MQLSLSYDWQQRQQALSARLLQFSELGQVTPLPRTQQLLSESLTYGLAATLARLLPQLHYVNRGRSVLQALLQEFNQQQGLALTYDEFARIGWLRYINREVVIPQVVQRFLWEIERNEQQGKPTEIPADKVELVAFLRVVDHQFYRDARPTISQTALTAFLAQHAHPAVDAAFLVRRKILSQQGATYYWEGGDYALQLRNELAAALWQERRGRRMKAGAFGHFVRQLLRADIWPNALHQLLPPAQTLRLGKLATELLLTEPDLADAATGLRTLWLDAPSYAHIPLTRPVPHAQLTGTTSLELLNCFRQLEWSFREVLDFQPSRQVYELLLRLATAYDPKYPRPYQRTLHFLRALDRPYLVKQTFKNLSQFNPEAIPYLLDDSELAPLAFWALAELPLKPSLVAAQDNREAQRTQLLQLQGSLWLELFGLALEAVARVPHKTGDLIGQVLYDLAARAYTKPGDGYYQAAGQQASATLYQQAVTLLGAARSQHARHPSGEPVRLATELLPGLCAMLRRVTLPVSHELLQVNLALFDLSIRVLQLPYRTGQPASDSSVVMEASQAAEQLIRHLWQLLANYFATRELLVEQYLATGPVRRPAKSSPYYFGLELLDWGYLLGQWQRLGLLARLATQVATSVQLDRAAADGKYSGVNQREADKLRFYLKVLLLGYLDLHENQAALRGAGLPVTETSGWLEQAIEAIALQHSHDDVLQGRLDLFEERPGLLSYDPHWVSLTTLLFRSINQFQNQSRTHFITQFFAQSADVGRMLSALNLLDARKLQAVITDRLAHVSVEDFIASRFTITDLQATLLAAVNSASHWQQFAEPLLARVKRHFEHRHYQPEWVGVLFEIELLLAFKSQDKPRLLGLAIPKLPAHVTRSPVQLDRLKQFYLALYLLKYEKTYAKATRLLKSLLALDDHNVRFAFQLYRARTLQAVHTDFAPENATQMLDYAQQQWETFLVNLSVDEKRATVSLAEAIDSNSLHYLARTESFARFDQVVNRLTNSYLFDEELIPVIYNTYRRRELPELAFAYLDKATQYYLEHDDNVPAVVDELRRRALDYKTIDRLKPLLGSLRNQPADIIPQLLPPVVNGHSRLDEFILRELVLAARAMVDKIQSIRQIGLENRYNDLLFALLELRFAVWGWSIHDQPRVGTSSGEKDAGEADLLFKAAGDTIALVEALILRSTAYTEEHILKCYSYVDVTRYYVVVYHKGKPANFDTAWQTYQNTVLAISYPPGFIIDKSKGFEPTAANPEADSYLRVARTRHGTKYTMFHLLISLGE